MPGLGCTRPGSGSAKRTCRRTTISDHKFDGISSGTERMGGCCVSWWRVTCETRTKQPRLFPACSQSPTNPRHQATMRSTILSVLCVLCVSVGALQLPQGALSRRAAIGAAVSAVVPAAATAALVQNPYGPEALGYTQPVDSAVPVATARCPGLLGRTRVLLVQPAITAHSRRA